MAEDVKIMSNQRNAGNFHKICKSFVIIFIFWGKPMSFSDVLWHNVENDEEEWQMVCQYRWIQSHESGTFLFCARCCHRR